MVDIDKETLKEVLNDVLNKGRSINDPIHKRHHDFVENLIQEREDNKAMWKKFRLTFVGTIATAAVGGLIWVGKLVLDAIQHGGGHS